MDDNYHSTDEIENAIAPEIKPLIDRSIPLIDRIDSIRDAFKLYHSIYLEQQKPKTNKNPEEIQETKWFSDMPNRSYMDLIIDFFEKLLSANINHEHLNEWIYIENLQHKQKLQEAFRFAGTQIPIRFSRFDDEELEYEIDEFLLLIKINSTKQAIEFMFLILFVIYTASYCHSSIKDTTQSSDDSINNFCEFNLKIAALFISHFHYCIMHNKFSQITGKIGSTVSALGFIDYINQARSLMIKNMPNSGYKSYTEALETVKDDLKPYIKNMHKKNLNSKIKYKDISNDRLPELLREWLNKGYFDDILGRKPKRQ